MSGRCSRVVDAGDLRREDVRLKTGLVQQIILEEQAGIGGLIEGRNRRKGVWLFDQLDKAVLQRLRKALDVSR